MNFVVIDIGLESFPPLLFAALRFGLIALPAIFFVPRPDVRWPAVVGVGLFIGVGQFGLLFVAMNIGLPAGLASVIAPLQPVFTIPLAVIALGERPSLPEVIGVGDTQALMARRFASPTNQEQPGGVYAALRHQI